MVRPKRLFDNLLAFLPSTFLRRWLEYQQCDLRHSPVPVVENAELHQTASTTERDHNEAQGR